MSSTSRNRCSENIRICAVVVPELKLSNIQRHIFGADFVKCPDYAALKDAPKAFNRVRMDRAYDVPVLAVVNGSVWQAVRQSVIATPIIRSEQANFVGNNFADEFACGGTSYALQYSRNDIAFALCSTNDWRFLIVVAFLFIPVPVFVFAADVGLIDLDNAAKLLLRLQHRGADFVAHGMGRLVRAKAHLSLNLQRRNSFLAGRHQVHDFEPLPQRLIRVLKNRARYVREAIALIFGARIALPLERHRANREHLGVFATWAANAIRPASRNQIPLAGIVVASREHGLKLGFRHLVNGLWALGCHGGDSVSIVTIVPFSVPVKPRIIAMIFPSAKTRTRRHTSRLRRRRTD